MESAKSRVNYYLVLSGCIEEANVPLVRAIADHLRKLSGDAELTIETVRPGSIILHIKGTAEGLARLTRSFQSGELRDILGYPLKRLGETTASQDLAEELPNKNSPRLFVGDCKELSASEETRREDSGVLPINKTAHVAAGVVIAGRYVLRELLGSSGVAEVWAATDAPNTWRPVAVKVFLSMAYSTAAEESFKRKILMLGLQRHCYTVELEARGRLFYSAGPLSSQSRSEAFTSALALIGKDDNAVVVTASGVHTSAAGVQLSRSQERRLAHKDGTKHLHGRTEQGA